MSKSQEKHSFIKVRGGFSDSTGITPYSVGLQIEDFDIRTRTILSNTIFQVLEIAFGHNRCQYRFDPYGYGNEGGNAFCKSILSNVFAERINLRQGYSFDWRAVYDSNIHMVVAEGSYNEVLDIIWFVCEWLYNNIVPQTDAFYEMFNSVFEQESVGYRFVDTKIVAITDENEIAEINMACNCKFDGCKSHMKKAVGFLADMENKDYKNSIKESISAVESVCQIIVGDDKATLGQALKVLKNNGLNLHSALERAMSALYGYTSDEGGIRHCEGLFESNVSFEEAKFMLVSCSAFLNYLIAESGKYST